MLTIHNHKFFSSVILVHSFTLTKLNKNSLKVQGFIAAIQPQTWDNVDICTAPEEIARSPVERLSYDTQWTVGTWLQLGRQSHLVRRSPGNRTRSFFKLWSIPESFRGKLLTMGSYTNLTFTFIDTQTDELAV